LYRKGKYFVDIMAQGRIPYISQEISIHIQFRDDEMMRRILSSWWHRGRQDCPRIPTFKSRAEISLSGFGNLIDRFWDLLRMTADFRKVSAHPGPCNSDYTTWFFEIALLSGPLGIFTQGIWYDVSRTAIAQQQSALLHAFVHPGELNAEWA
jgi:hypothetical protein